MYWIDFGQLGLTRQTYDPGDIFNYMIKMKTYQKLTKY